MPEELAVYDKSWKAWQIPEDDFADSSCSEPPTDEEVGHQRIESGNTEASEVVMISDKRASGSKHRDESYSSVAGYGDQIRQFFANVRDPAKIRALVIRVALKLDAVFSAADAFQNGAAVEKELGPDLVKGLVRYCRNMQLQRRLLSCWAKRVV